MLRIRLDKCRTTDWDDPTTYISPLPARYKYPNINHFQTKIDEDAYQDNTNGRVYGEVNSGIFECIE